MLYQAELRARGKALNRFDFSFFFGHGLVDFRGKPIGQLLDFLLPVMGLIFRNRLLFFERLDALDGLMPNVPDRNAALLGHPPAA